MTGMAAEAPLVLVVDDEAAVRTALDSLLRSVGFRVACFASPEEFLDSGLAPSAGCLVLDVRLQMASGLDVQAQLVRAGCRIPVVFMTGHGDIPMSVRAMKAGAVDFLAKPFRDQDMLDAVAAAIERDRDRRAAAQRMAEVVGRYETLTPRERQIMTLVVDGLMNKEIAAQLGVAEITIKIHRGQVMRKMAARSVADLVRIAGVLDEQSQ
ncbi:response regulator transcription factor [Inquilinus sp. Marseille-Q2685]|uniref:response regulator transcription factor n=1 Tax=Inquilinus sp. Marseille-Q2685 TaxID=2866581 RepID=UPI001CE490C3|nr:response regulator transcription factor [Inquilinus sp. Marseille-Q2685]